MKKDLNSYILTREEFRIMKIVWERGGATVRDVCDAISRNKDTAYTTVLTFMQILEQKGALVRCKAGRAYFYSPVLSRRQATRNQIHDLLQRFFDGSPDRLIEVVSKNQLPFSKPGKSSEPLRELEYEAAHASASRNGT
jgi:BlaI family penicillinase repressor